MRGRWRSEQGVFVPGLMGAGILLSIAMLISDGARKLFPIRGDRARFAHARAAALGRANDLRAVVRGAPPVPARISHVPRGRLASIVLGLLAGASAAAVLAATHSFFNSDLAGLAGREEWGFGAGWMAAALLGSGSVIWLTAGALGSRRPSWLDRLAALPPLGELPPPDEAVRLFPGAELADVECLARAETPQRTGREAT
ncbi:MAG: hypothetical protein HYU28_02030 [Actinobacteria bacterium]|nr:hypothetical protein [Actinomycetota bacterium]